MAGPNYGALGATFKCARLFQAICMIGVIGMTANFISEMISANDTPSDVLVGTLSVVSISKAIFVIKAKYRIIDLHLCALLRHYSHSLHRRHPSIPPQYHHGRPVSNCSHRRCRCRRQAFVIPKLQSHRECECYGQCIRVHYLSWEQL